MSLDRRNSSTLLLGIIGGLVTIIVLFFSYQWFFSSSSQTPPKHSEKSVANPTKTVTQAASEATPPVTTDEKTIQLVDEQLVKAPIPSNESLAKEEVAKLEDVQTQLKDQAVTLKAQHADADNLIALKEEQIKLLEAQLAQKP